jgi:hypothetical protein
MKSHHWSLKNHASVVAYDSKYRKGILTFKDYSNLKFIPSGNLILSKRSPYERKVKAFLGTIHGFVDGQLNLLYGLKKKVT